MNENQKKLSSNFCAFNFMKKKTYKNFSPSSKRKKHMKNQYFEACVNKGSI